MPLQVYIDAISQGNPGPAGIGIVLRDQDERIIQQAGRFLGERTDQEAAAQGLLAGLEAAAALDPSEIAVFSTSQWLVRQLTGQGHEPGTHLAIMLAQAQMLLLRFDTWRIIHLPAEQNALPVALAENAATARHDVDAPRSQPVPVHDRTARDRPVAVRVSQGANTRTCPEPCGTDEVFEFGEVAPAHMCLHALQAVLEVVMACKRNDEQVTQDLPITKPCAKPGCGAVFVIDLR